MGKKWMGGEEERKEEGKKTTNVMRCRFNTEYGTTRNCSRKYNLLLTSVIQVSMMRHSRA